MKKSTIQFQKGLSFSDFLKDYGDESQCFEALVKMRWPSEFQCPKCGSTSHCRLKTRHTLFQCNDCRTQTSVMAGTIFHSTKLPLTKWFLAIYLMTQSKNGISQLELARQVGVSPNTGAALYHKLAQVMLERDMDKPLSHKIEMDDAYWGGKKKGKRGRGSENKTPFIAVVEKNESNHPQRIKLHVVNGFKKREIKQWASKHLQEGAVVASDGLSCFRGSKDAGYEHEVTVVGKSQDPRKTAPFNWVNTVLGNLKTALTGTFHKLSRPHLPRHLATFQYRFNRRFILEDMLSRLVYVSLRTPPMPKRLLVLAENRW